MNISVVASINKTIANNLIKKRYALFQGGENG